MTHALELPDVIAADGTAPRPAPEHPALIDNTQAERIRALAGAMGVDAKVLMEQVLALLEKILEDKVSERDSVEAKARAILDRNPERHKAFGLWKGSGVDARQFQNELRGK